MRTPIVLLLAVGLALPVLAQADFELDVACTTFPTPIGASGSPEGISWNGVGTGAFPDTGSSTGFPVTGAQYGFLIGEGPAAVTPPAGGPFTRPDPAVPELAFPIPAGATFVSFYWDHGNSDGPSFNDGMSIDIVDATGAVIVPLVYADGNSPPGTGLISHSCGLTFTRPEVAPDGPQYFQGSLPYLLPPGAYLSMVCWNGGDSSVDPLAIIDTLSWCTQPFAEDFETTPACLNFPITPLPNPTCVTWNGVGNGCYPDTNSGTGFPVSGSQYAFMNGEGPAAVKPQAGGPFFRPDPGVPELRILVPTGATHVSFYWDHGNDDGPFFNDGMSIDIVDGGGSLLFPLVYADGNSPIVPGSVINSTCPIGNAAEIAPPGPQFFSGDIPFPLPVNSYLSLVCWNGGDSAVDPVAVLDDVRFFGPPMTQAFDFGPADCSQTFPTPCDPLAPPGLPTWSGSGSSTGPFANIATIGGGNGAGFPADGAHGYLFMKANDFIGPGSGSIPIGGPLPRPIPPGVNEVCIVLPTFTTNISFCWDFYYNDGIPYNDALSIDIIDPGGAVFAALVYADSSIPAGTGIASECGYSGPERAPDGPNYFTGSFLPTPAGSYLSIVVANDGDTAGDSLCAVDNIVTGPRRLRFIQPVGGDILIQNLGAQPGKIYRTFLTFNPQVNPWFFGLDILPGEAIDQLSNPAYNGPPFVGFLSSCGSSAFYVPPFGLPPGIQVSSVTLLFDDALLGPYIGQTAPVTYTSF